MELKADTITGLSDYGLHMNSSSRDSPDVFLDYRFLSCSSLRPETRMWNVRRGSSVGTGSVPSASPGSLQSQEEMESPGAGRPISAPRGSPHGRAPAVSTLAAVLSRWQGGFQEEDQHYSDVNKLKSTGFSSSALMELAAHMKPQGVKADVQRSPGEANRQADRLANGDFSDFGLAYRTHLDPGSLSWYVLDDVTRRRARPRVSQEVRSAGTTRREKRMWQDERLKFGDP